MKFYLPIIASLFLASTPFVPPAVASETRIIAQEINPYIKNNIAREISVKITSEENGGSGVIIAQQDNTYLILTNAHVLRNGSTFDIQTRDGITHQAKPVANGIETDDDLALLEFSSDNSYQSATINSAATPRVDQSILAVGYDAATGKLVVEEGKIERVPDKTFKDGYSIGYSNNIVQGMSGGAILNADGEVIGINGKSAFPIVNTGYLYQDGTKPSTEEIEQLRQLSWGLTINRLLTQVNPEIITAYGLPQPEVAADIGSTQLTGWLGKLEEKAKQITVKIDSSSGTNGSGVIIAKQGNTYTVLTADHVICEKNTKTRKCIDYTYELVAPDGQQYSLNPITFKRQEGVDLAVVQFTSNEQYKVAELANYPVANKDAIFVAGYPQLNLNKPAKWAFTLGYGLEREQGLLTVNTSGNIGNSGNNLENEQDLSVNDLGDIASPEISNSVSSQGSLPGGYEMVYTSTTYGGMSGGAVLDKKGRVIGIHGLAEGEIALDTQRGSGKQIQFGYSLGIPVNTFIGLLERFGINNPILVQNNRPAELNAQEKKDFETATLETKTYQGNTTPEGWLERGNLLWRLQQYGKSVEAFDRAIKLDPEFVYLAHYGKGIALLKDKQYEGSLASFKNANQINPDFAPAFSWKSAVFLKRGQWKKALAAIEQAILLQNNNPVFYFDKGRILRQLNRYQEAISAYNKAIEISPRSSFYGSRALIYQDADKIELALADYNKALEINPNDGYALVNQANIYQDRNQQNLALSKYNKAVEINPTNPHFYLERGSFYIIQKQQKLALADYSKALSIDPENTSTLNSIAEAYRYGSVYPRNPQKALEIYQKSSELEDNFAAIRAADMLTEGEEVEANYNLAGKLLLSAANRDSFQARARLVRLIVSQRIANESNLDVEEMAIAADENGYPDGLDALIGSLREGRNGYQTDLKKAAFLAIKAFKRFDERLFSEEGAWPIRGKSYAYTIEKAIKNGAIDEDEISVSIPDLKRYYSFTSEGFRRFTIPIDCKQSGSMPFHVYIWDAEESIVPLQNQFKWAEQSRGCKVSQDVKNSFDMLYHIAKKENVSFLELATYTLREAAAQKDRAATNSNEVASTTQEQSYAPNDAPTYINKGIAYLEQDKADLAIEQFTKAIELDPNNINYYLKRGEVYQAQQSLELALADFDKALELNPQNSKTLLSRGTVYSSQKKLDLALADFNKAIALNPQYTEAYRRRAFLYMQQQQPELAIVDLDRVVELNPDYYLAYTTRALLNRNLGKLDLAIADYTKAIKFHPQQASLYKSRGKIYAEISQYKLALNDLEKALKLEPDYFTYFSRAELYISLGEPEKALADLNESIKIEPQHSFVFHSRGKIYSSQGKLDLALASYNKAIELNADEADYYSSRATVYYKQGEPELAISDLNKVIELNPQRAMAYNNRGILYKEQGILDLAVADYNKAIELNPDDFKAYANRGIVRLLQGKLDLALTDYSVSRGLDQNNLAAITTGIGLVKYEMGAVEEAKQQFQQSIKADQTSAGTQLALAVTLFSSGDRLKSLSIAEEALNVDRRLANVEYLKNLWGKKLIADTEKLLAHPKIKTLLSQE